MKRKVVLLNSCKGLYGGVESFLLNVFRHLDKDKFDVSFLTCGISTYDMYRKEIEEKGGRVECVNIYPGDLQSEYKVYKELYTYFLNNKPDVVHINSSALSFQILASAAAKKAGMSSIILHSHNFVPNIKPWKAKCRKILKPILTRNGTRFLACSSGAAKWMFEDRILDKVEVIPNGIRSKDFEFSYERRSEFRKKNGIKNTDLVLGNIGRFQKQKNHEFMIDILKILVENKSDVLLLLVGEGELKEKIVQYAINNGVINHVRFLGERKDIGDFLSAIDVFVFPSLFEGFGIAALEAQASGVYTVVADTIPLDVNVTGEVVYLPIHDAQVWADEIMSIDLEKDRFLYNSIIENSIYDDEITGERMQNIYLEN